MDIIFILLALVSGLLFTIGDVFLKYWSIRASPYMMGIGFLFYIIAGVAFAYSLKRKEFAVAVAVLICFNLLSVALIGLMLFKEALGVKEMIGIGLALGAIILLTM